MPNIEIQISATERVNLANKISYNFEYYGANKARELLHRMKVADPIAIKIMAVEMCKLIPTGSVLIPLPSRSGQAESTFLLCKELEKLICCTTADILEGHERKSVYDLKKQNVPIPPNFYGFRLKEGGIAPKGGKLVLVDGIIATGRTMLEAMTLIPESHAVVHAVDFLAFGLDEKFWKARIPTQKAVKSNLENVTTRSHQYCKRR